jgi:type IV pilus assembly protein PilO
MAKEDKKDAGKDKKKSKSKLKLDIKDPNVRNVLIAVAVIAFLGYMWYDQVYVPLHTSIAALSDQKEKLDAELLKINALKPQLEKLRMEAAERTAKLDSLKNILPDRKEVARLIREMSTVNRRSNVATTRFTPKPDVEKEYYIENKYDVSVAGDYHNLGALFSYLANFQLIVNLSNVSITANPGYASGKSSSAPGVESQPSVLATFEMTTFSSKR